MEIPFGELKTSLHRMSALYRIRMHNTFTGTPLHFGQFPMLQYIMDHNGCTQRELALKMLVSPPSIATSVKRMQRAGLIQKAADENDQRCNRLSVTEEGRLMVLHFGKEFSKLDSDLFAGFSPEECAQLTTFLNRMSDNLATEELKGKSVFLLLAEEFKLHMNDKEGHNRG